jgi:hypothetical protein
MDGGRQALGEVRGLLMDELEQLAQKAYQIGLSTGRSVAQFDAHPQAFMLGYFMGLSVAAVLGTKEDMLKLLVSGLEERS